ncbi:MAG: Rab family GTPase [Promethearchaeota archaeon]
MPRNWMRKSLVGRYLFKMLLAGAGGCGKTTFLNRFTKGNFSSNTKMTIGVDFAVHFLEIPAYGNVTLQIWDFGGEARFRTMLPSFCLGASGCLMLFDLVRLYTFYELQDWLKIIKSNTNNIPIILLGSKFDLLDSSENLAIKPDEISEFIKENNLSGYFNISSKSGKNIQESFRRIAELMLMKKQI